MLEVHFKSLIGPKLSPFEIHQDNRGSFRKIMDVTSLEFRENKHISVSVSNNLRSGTVRGLHFQASPFEEFKMISCISGSIFDVLVDIRPNSPHFKQWARIELSSSTPYFLEVPPGFAHGFQTLQDDTNVMYVICGQYSSESSRRIHFRDPNLAIQWPLEVSEISIQDNSADDLDLVLRKLI